MWSREKLFFPLLVLAASTAWAADKEYEMKNQYISLKLIPRTPNQMAAFYEARGFPKNAIHEIRKGCFITVIIKNFSHEIVWLELARWEFGAKRLDRTYWRKTWQGLSVPLAYQSTFGWTQLPDSRDLRPDEPVGGNVVVLRQAKPFDVSARFRLAGKENSNFSMNLTGVRCAQDPQ